MTAKIAVYGAKSRPDSYPHQLWRVVPPNIEAERLAFGMWMPAHANPPMKSSLDAEAEKGTLFEYDSLPSVYPWDHEGEGPAFVRGVRMTLFVPEAQLETIASGRVADALEESPWMAVATLFCRQSNAWWIVQRSKLGVRDRRIGLAGEPLQTFAFATREANEKKCADLLSMERGNRRAFSSMAELAVSIAEPPRTWDNWRGWVRDAAKLRLTSVAAQKREAEQQRRAAAKQAQIEKHKRLAELSAKPVTQLTSAEYQEKLKLKRELANVS